jgi:hypothetical protein
VPSPVGTPARRPTGPVTAFGAWIDPVESVRKNSWKAGRSPPGTGDVHTGS